MPWNHEICRAVQFLHVNMCPTNHRAQFSNPSVQEKADSSWGPVVLWRVLGFGETGFAKTPPKQYSRVLALSYQENLAIQSSQETNLLAYLKQRIFQAGNCFSRW